MQLLFAVGSVGPRINVISRSQSLNVIFDDYANFISLIVELFILKKYYH